MSNADPQFSSTLGSPASITAWLIQARDWQRKGNLVEAQGCCQRILTIQPNQVETLKLLGMLLQQRGQWIQAEQTIRQAIRVAPVDATAYASLGAILVAQCRHEEAVTPLSHAIRLRPGDGETRIILGEAFRALNRLPEAVAVWRQASASRPHDPDLHYRLGLALAEWGNDEEAIVELAAAHQGNPAHDPVIILLTTLLYRHCRVEEARNLIGDALFQRGGAEKAMALLQHWQSVMPDDPIIQHRLAAWCGQEAPLRAADAYVTDLFDRYADSFDEALAGLAYRAPVLIAEQLAEVAGTPAGQWRALDAGCGTGLCGPLLRPWARHLTGVDLSPGMVGKAGQRGCYDELVVAELTTFLTERPASYDLIASADTLIYFGNLRPVFNAAAHALHPGGWLAVTVEQAPGETAPDGFRLNQSGRYGHTADYVERTLTASGLPLRAMNAVTLRLEAGEPVAGYAVLAQRPGEATA